MADDIVERPVAWRWCYEGDGRPRHWLHRGRPIEAFEASPGYCARIVEPLYSQEYVTRLRSALTTTADDALRDDAEWLRRFRQSALMLLQNSEGCAVNHYGEDYQGRMPGWLVDCRRDIEKGLERISRLDHGEAKQPSPPPHDRSQER